MLTDAERIRRLERLLEISRNLSARLEPAAVLQAVIAAAMELTDSEAASILLYDEETGQLKFTAATPEHWDALKNQVVPIRGSLAGQALVHQETRIVENARQTPQHFQGVDEKLNYETRNLMAVPLLREGQPLGVLEVLNKRHGHYDEEDVKTLEVLAAHAAVALHNARLMEAAQQAYEELRRLNKLKSDFVAISSHELRTPLGIILGYATHLRELVDDELKEPMDAIVRAAIRLRDIIEGLSHLENYQRGTIVLWRERTNMNALLEEIVEYFQEPARERQIALVLTLPPEPIYAEVDADKMKLVLRHLLENALAFTGEGGHVWVTLEAPKDYVQITITDDGVGIPEEDLPHIFDSFYQVEKHLTRRHGGMGLGLAIARIMIEAHGGLIWAESEEGRGSTFTVLVPQTADKASQQQALR